MDKVIKTYLKFLNEQAKTENDEEDFDVTDVEETEETEDTDELETSEENGDESEISDDNEEEESEEESEEGSKLDELISTYTNKESISKDDIVELLNIAICDELLAQYNYLRSYTLSKTEGKADFDQEFEDHEREESDHAHKLIRRLRELNAPVMTVVWSDYVSNNSCGGDWKDETEEDSKIILQNRYNEEVNAIKFYALILTCIKKMKESGDWDTTTERLIKSIKADEEAHEQDLRDLLVQYGMNPEIETSGIAVDEEGDEDEDFEDDENFNETEDETVEAEDESEEDEIEDEA